MKNSIAIDINADMGECFGRWVLGNDAALMPHVTSANIACGFHAGDPHIMRECVRLAKLHGVGVGAHVGFLDLMGFGRRRIDLTPAQLRDHVIYQVGAHDGLRTGGRRVRRARQAPQRPLQALHGERGLCRSARGALKELDFEP